MPASGTKETMSEAELEQRQEARRSHGAYAFQGRGEQALEPSKRSRFVELQEQITDKGGVIGLMQDRAIKAVMVCELIESYIGEEVEKGAKAPDIPALKSLPAFWNSAQRALSSLLSVMDDTDKPLDITDLMKGGENGSD